MIKKANLVQVNYKGLIHAWYDKGGPIWIEIIWKIQTIRYLRFIPSYDLLEQDQSMIKWPNSN